VVGGNQIRFGLTAVKNVGDAAIDIILTEREGKGKFLSRNSIEKSLFALRRDEVPGRRMRDHVRPVEAGKEQFLRDPDEGW
jgi:hypothetical protein